MTITINGKLVKKFSWQFIHFLRWPVGIASVAFILSPNFWNYWKSNPLDLNLLLNYIRELKWPILILFIFFITRQYIPEILNRIEELTAGKFGLKLRKPQPSALDDSDEIVKLPESTKTAAPSSDDSSDDELGKLLTSPEVEAQYENIYNNIYGSQLMVLKRLQKNAPTGMTEDQLMNLYGSHKASSTNPYPSFEHFMQYLDDSVLTLYDVNDRKYKLTNAGSYFLQYLQKTGRYSIIPQN